MTNTPPLTGTSRFHQMGRTSWSALGVIGLLVVIAMALGAISGIVVPLVIAVIFGVLLEPLVEWQARRGVSRLLGATVALTVALLATVIIIAIVVRGFVQQLPQIVEQFWAGWYSLLEWARTLDLDPVLLERIRTNVERYLPKLGQGLFGLASGTFSGLAAFGMGSFFAVFFLFFILRDLHRFPAWLARTTSWDAQLTEKITTVVKQSLRGYFKGIAITAVVTAPIFMVPVLLLRIPLAGAIFILYFVLSFIPFLGAWIAGAFTVLIAFGSGGASAAAIIGITFLFSNGAIQSAVSSWALGSALRLHPLVVLLSTLIGGTVAGLMGMVLAAPLVAATIRSLAAVRELRAVVPDA